MTTDLEALARAVKRAQHRQHRALEAALTHINTTVVQWDAMRAIERSPGASAHDLAVATFQTDQSFGTLANRLEAQQWIERRSGTGRRIEHSLTVAGKQKLREANVIVERVRLKLFAPLSEVDKKELARILDTLLLHQGDLAEWPHSKVKKPWTI